MAAWGTLTWSTGNFGDQTNSTFPPNGIGASFNLGTVVITATVDFGWSNNEWGLVDWNTNELNADGIVTGFGMTSTLGDETTVNEVNVGWGRLLWGENAWGIAGDVAVTGFSLSSNLGSVTTQANADVIPTSLPMTASQGDEFVEIATEVFLENNPLPDISANLGTADAGPDAMLQGIGATSSVGNVEAYNLEGWGRYFWGQFEWGATGEWESVELTGIALSANVGTLAATGTASVDVTGEAMTAAEGIVDPSPDATVTGIGFTADLAVGTVTIADANTDVTGEAMTASLGNESITGTANLTLTGFGITAAEGIVDPAPDAEVTGIGFDADLAVGTVVAGNADVTVVGEGFAAGLGVGTLDAVTLADVTGIAMSANLGSVTIIAEGKVTLTGLGLTMAEGTNRTLIWNQVNTGTAPTWTEVDTAA
jgi:hypothetical protein